MPLLTTCIGAYPKPDFVKLPDWFNVEDGPDTANPTRYWEDAIKAMGPDAMSIINEHSRSTIKSMLVLIYRRTERLFVKTTFTIIAGI